MSDPAPKKPKKRRKPKGVMPKFIQKRAAGRPILYEREAHCARAKRLGLLGLTEQEIAFQFGISPETMQAWKAKHTEFSVSLDEGKVDADAYVADSHYQRAVGYNYEAERVLVANGVPTLVKFREHVPGDVGAQKSWLHNRQPDRWRERKQVELTGSLEHRISLMTPEQRRTRLIELQAKAAQIIEGEATEVKE